jgi:hypothetical protein
VRPSAPSAATIITTVLVFLGTMNRMVAWFGWAGWFRSRVGVPLADVAGRRAVSHADVVAKDGTRASGTPDVVRVPGGQVGHGERVLNVDAVRSATAYEDAAALGLARCA